MACKTSKQPQINVVAAVYKEWKVTPQVQCTFLYCNDIAALHGSVTPLWPAGTAHAPALVTDENPIPLLL